ncbi:MAG: alpha/beta hydrolase [Bacteroidia bacterium]|nr:alpha/beta hydrolase [Bacteroidia bacterium]MDW8157707.1 alpha/beta hydrolase [Bacteroidia bacterium]
MKPPLLLVHGALGNKEMFKPIARVLESFYTLHLVELEGHGNTPIQQYEFSVYGFVKQVEDYIYAHQLEGAYYFGYSLGGYIGLVLAAEKPGLLTKVFALATKLAWDGNIAQKEADALHPTTLLEKNPSYIKTLGELHPATEWQNLVSNTARLMLELGENPILCKELLKSISIPVRLAVGDKDRLISLEETIQAYRALPMGQLQVFPRTPHAWEKMKYPLILHAIRDFFDE